MKRRYLLNVILILFLILSCNSEDYTAGNNSYSGISIPPTSSKFDYSITISDPDTSIKKIDESIPIKIDFKSGTNKTVHYIQVRIYNKSNNNEIYKKPDNNHVDDGSGSYTFIDNLVLSSGNGFSSGSSFVLETKVWSPDKEEKEVIKTVEFKVN
jgi:uncharacterized protein YcfL